MSRTPSTKNPEFPRVSQLVNETISELSRTLDCTAGIDRIGVNVNRVTDDMTKMFLRAINKSKQPAPQPQQPEQPEAAQEQQAS